MAGFIFDARAALSEIQDRTPATTATTATKPSEKDKKSQLSQLSQPPIAEITNPDPDAYEERAAIIEHDAGLPRQEAETLAAQEQGHADADSLHGDVVGRWAVEIERLAKIGRASCRERV